jgi:hypothetical protein
MTHANPVPEFKVLLLPRPTIAICQPPKPAIVLCGTSSRSLHLRPTKHLLHYHILASYSPLRILFATLLRFVIVASERSATSNAYTRHSLALRTLPLVRRSTPDEHLRGRTRIWIIGTESRTADRNAKCVRALSG